MRNRSSLTATIAAIVAISALAVLGSCSSGPAHASPTAPPTPAHSPAPNPIFPGWYADPEALLIDGTAWIFPTTSAKYDDQTFLDAFSSPDLVTWTRHPRVLEMASIPWARRAMWAPAVFPHNGRYYLFFSANDIQNNEQVGGIGVAVADQPEGPYADHLGRPLIDRFHNGAQPIDQFVFKDRDGSIYMIYGGWRHCNIVRLNDTLTGFLPHADGTMFKEITPQGGGGYVEGPFMLQIGTKYYFMWSEGGWTSPDYSVAYAIADSPLGPFTRVGTILKQDAAIATGAGHHSVIQWPTRRKGEKAEEGSGVGQSEHWIVYHRRPLGHTDANHRVVCMDRLEFDKDGWIMPVRMTLEVAHDR